MLYDYKVWITSWYLIFTGFAFWLVLWFGIFTTGFVVRLIKKYFR